MWGCRFDNEVLIEEDNRRKLAGRYGDGLGGRGFEDDDARGVSLTILIMSPWEDGMHTVRAYTLDELA